MRIRWTVIALVGLGLIGCASVMKSEEKEEKEGNEIKLTIDQVPAAVKTALQKEAEGATVQNVEKESEDGKTTYETDVTIGGKKYEIKVAEDGTLISKKIEMAEDEKKEEKKDEKK